MTWKALKEGGEVENAKLREELGEIRVSEYVWGKTGVDGAGQCLLME